MPQIWMTYDEIGALLDCSALEAQARIHFEGLDRKLSRDGKKRAKLNVEMMGIFIARVKAMDEPLDRAVHDMKSIYKLLSIGRPDRPSSIKSASAR